MSIFNTPEKEEKPPQNPLGLVVGAVSFAAAYFGLRAFSIETRMQIYIGAGVGLLLGLIPLFVGKQRGHQRYGLLSLFACIVAGAIGGALIAVPLTW